MTRDMTQQQFDRECARYGFTPEGFMGYYHILLSAGQAVNVSVWNAGPNRRARLAYLLEMQAENERRIERETAATTTGEP